MSTLWSNNKKPQPLAELLRPTSLSEYVGQKHILGQGKMLRRIIEADKLSSMLFVGPPGTGKTSLAHVIAAQTSCRFTKLSAVLDGVGAVREAIEKAENALEMFQERTILFIDEIHRFNKSQQDALLPWVESGTIILIGATTENPSFEVNKALLSRMKVFRLTRLSEQDMGIFVGKAMAHYKELSISVSIDDDALSYWCRTCDGDARSLLSAFELAVTSELTQDDAVHITLSVAEETMQQRSVSYDKGGDEHYDTISAFIKSMRGSHVDASLYWLAKMLLAGEDPKFIARRMIILASEDIGNADPKALWLAQSCFESITVIGMPEAELILSQVVSYLAAAPKSNSATTAIAQAKQAVLDGQNISVPCHLMDTHYKGSIGEGYDYPHNHPGNFVQQNYLPDGVEGGFYAPSDQGYEAHIKRRMDELWD